MKQALNCTQQKFGRIARYMKDGKLDLLFAYCMMNATVCFPLHDSICAEASETCEYSSICAVDLHLYACKNTIVSILISHLSLGYFSNKHHLALERTSGVQSPIGTAFVSVRLQRASCLWFTQSPTLWLPR